MKTATPAETPPQGGKSQRSEIDKVRGQLGEIAKLTGRPAFLVARWEWNGKRFVRGHYVTLTPMRRDVVVMRVNP
jgi:hypothetical protein